MREIAERLQFALPISTGLFSSQLQIVSISATAAQATIVTDGRHNLSNGDVVNLAGNETRTPISSVQSNGFVHTFTTSADHDLTEGNPDQETVTLLGFNDVDWNDAFELVLVPNRRTFAVRSTVAPPTLIGSENLLEPNRIDGVNGRFPVTVLSPTSFTIDGTFQAGTYTPVNGRVTALPRIAVCIDGERAAEIYRTDPDDFWLFVMPGPAAASKDRRTLSDAIASRSSGAEVRLNVVDKFDLLIFAPVNDQMAAEEAIDVCRHDLLRPISRALLNYKIQTGLSCPENDYGIVLTGHGVEDYNRATLVYRYEFEAPYDLLFEDSAGSIIGDRAFRDVNYSQTNAVGAVTSSVNLDDQPL